MSRPSVTAGTFVAVLVLVSSALTALSVSSAERAGQGGQPTVRDLLRDIAQATDTEWAAVTRGEPVAKVLSSDNREVAVAGAVRIAASSDRLVDRYRDIENLKRSAIVLDIGRLSQPPRPSDFSTLPFEPYSLDLRDCRPGDCRVRLGDADIARFHRDVDWNAADWRERSTAVWRETLSGYAAAYARDGRRALPTFANKREPLSVADDLSLIVDRFRFVSALSPEFFAYLREFGSGGPTGMDQVMYWSKEDFGVRPVIRMSHQVVHRTTGTPRVVLIATNQIYADHYLDASLSLTLTIDASEGAGQPAFYMISASRARTRSLTGLMRSFVRSTVQNRSRDALRKILAATKGSLEGKK
jgi:hypothetical protein